jgi:UDP-glucose 4-epimerase
MNILVTGGTGYIGAHTSVELIKKGHQPILVDNLSNSHEETRHAIEKITGTAVDFYNIDLCDKIGISSLLRTLQVDAVIHFAAFKSVNESVENPLRYYHNNIDSLTNLLDAVTDNGIQYFVFSSSCTVYGTPKTSPVTEDTLLERAESPYGVTKQLGERIVADVMKAHRMKGISLRYFNPAGAHESALIGEFPLQAPTNLVPVITQTAAGLRPSMHVYGNDYNTHDGTCVRDYIHVVDVARAHVAALDRLTSPKMTTAHEVYNLGAGKGFTILEVIRAFETMTGMKLNYAFGERRPGDVEQIWADATLAEKILGWKAQFSLDDIVGSAWKWELQLKNVSKR